MKLDKQELVGRIIDCLNEHRDGGEFVVISMGIAEQCIKFQDVIEETIGEEVLYTVDDSVGSMYTNEITEIFGIDMFLADIENGVLQPTKSEVFDEVIEAVRTSNNMPHLMILVVDLVYSGLLKNKGFYLPKGYSTT